MMEQLHTRFMDWYDRLGDGFPSAVASGGVLRVWFVWHVADETGLPAHVVTEALDDWLADAPRADFPVDQHLGRNIERLLEERTMISPNADPYDLALVDMEIGTMLDDIGRPFDALSRYMAAKTAFIDAEAWLDAAIVDMEMGMVTTDLGWYTEAARFLTDARETVALLGQLDDFARVLIAQAALAGRNGDSNASREALEQARWLAYESKAAKTMAVATHNLANHLTGEGKFDEAIDMFTSTRDIYESMGDPVAAADCDKNMGNTLTMAGRFAEGLELARKALDVYTIHDHPVHRAHAHRTIAHAFHHLGQFAEADTELRSARTIYSEAGQPAAVAACEIDMSFSLRNLMRFDEAEEVLRSARSIHDGLDTETDDRWFDAAIASVQQGEVDNHTHPEKQQAA